MKIKIEKNVLAEEYAGRDDITEVEISGSVIRIGDAAFKGCENLTRVVCYGSDTHIGREAFKNCKKLSQFLSAKNLHLSPSAFAGCSKLNVIRGHTMEVPESCFRGCISLRTPLDAMFYKANAYESSGIEYLKIDENSPLKRIDEECFKGCEKLETLSVTKRVSIGSSAFEGCKKLRKADISGASDIGELCFMQCSRLREINWSKYTRSVPYAAFCECRLLSTVTGAERIETMGDFSFHNTRLSDENFPSRKERRAKNAFGWDDLVYEE